jgi:hypothetical protein
MLDGQEIAYVIAWDAGQSIDLTALGERVAFTGTISFPDAPDWALLPQDLSVTREILVIPSEETPTPIDPPTPPESSVPVPSEASTIPVPSATSSAALDPSTVVPSTVVPEIPAGTSATAQPSRAPAMDIPSTGSEGAADAAGLAISLLGLLGAVYAGTRLRSRIHPEGSHVG